MHQLCTPGVCHSNRSTHTTTPILFNRISMCVILIEGGKMKRIILCQSNCAPNRKLYLHFLVLVIRYILTSICHNINFSHVLFGVAQKINRITSRSLIYIYVFKRCGSTFIEALKYVTSIYLVKNILNKMS